MTAPALPAAELPDLLGTSPADLTAPGPVPAADLTTARQRAERIRTDLVTYSRMRQDIADAFAQRDWAALGYPSWYAYLEGEFGEELQQLARSREERQLAVGDLRGQGLSTRQIAAVAGVDAKTVRNDLAAAPAPAPEKVTGSDGKSYPAQQRQARGESEWEQVFNALTRLASETSDGWTRAKEVAEALGDGWSWSIVVRRLRVLHEAGRVELSTDRALTGVRGECWRPRSAATEPPAAATAGTPNHPAGPVPTADDPPAAATSRDPRPEDRPGPQLPAGRDPQENPAEPGEGSPAAVATPGQPGAGRPIVLVAPSTPGQPASRAEVWEDNGTNTVVKVVYCDSRTGAWVARKRILGPVEAETQPGPLRIAGSDAIEVHDHGVIHVGDRDIHLRAGRLDDDVPVTWLAVETAGGNAVETAGVPAELLALNALQVELLIGRLTAAHRWMVGQLNAANG